MANTLITTNNGVVTRTDIGQLTPGAGVDQAVGTVGVTSSGYYSQLVRNGTAFNYTLVIQLPVPIININAAMLAHYLFPSLTVPKIPQAVQDFIASAKVHIQNVLNDANDLVKYVPQLTVSILVKAGPQTVFNVELVAQKVPVNVLPPRFVLALPNIALGPDAAVPALPVPAPVIIEVPIPVPNLALPSVGIMGGQITASLAGTSVSAAPALNITSLNSTGGGQVTTGVNATSVTTPPTLVPVSIVSPIRLPVI
jgi:hypothetical protein